MRIQTKTAIVISISCLLIFGALHLAASCLILPSYQDIENKLSQDGVCQTLTTLHFRLSQMESRVTDYAAWDDTYKFVQAYDQTYVDANLDTAFENLDLNIIATMDTDGNLIYCKSYDHNYSEPIISGKETIAQLQSEKTIWSFQSVDEVKSGLMLIDGKITLIATAPVVTSQKMGPIMGEMLFGNYLDQQEIQQLSSIMGLNFTVSSMVDFENQNGGEQIVESLTANPQVVLVKPSSSEVISGYTLVDDLHGEPLFVLQVNQPRDSYSHGIVTRNIVIACSLILSVAFGASFLVILKKQIIAPLTNLATYVKNNFSEPNNTKITSKQKTDEVSVLAGAIRDSLNQKMETMNEVSRMVAHDLRNPLTGIKGAAYALKKNYGKEMGEKGLSLLQTIDDCVEYSNKIVSDLWEYSSEIKLDKTKNSPYKLVTNALKTLTLPQNIKIVNYASNDSPLNVDSAKMERVFSNIIKNASDAMPNGGILKIMSEKRQNEIEISFTDNGVGMSEEIVKKIGEPFFTTKAKGMGVGFSICKRIVEAHQGRIEVESVEGKGTKISVFLPTT